MTDRSDDASLTLFSLFFDSVPRTEIPSICIMPIFVDFIFPLCSAKAEMIMRVVLVGWLGGGTMRRGTL